MGTSKNNILGLNSAITCSSGSTFKNYKISLSSTSDILAGLFCLSELILLADGYRAL